MDLTIRLNILKEAGQIDEGIYKDIINIINMFKEKHNISLTEENASMLITHLAISFKRIKDGEIVNSIEEMIYEEVRCNENYDKSEEIFKDIEKVIESSIPEEEKVFIMMHLCALLNNK
ncbi:PRD domain-containing protein [Clostridium sp. MSJ-4]|uniref:PRD domain-containing protein n=1 Tax=Clostridium simiarum TaxID=2841506 RepID=A0ABS6F2S3_9CLOT|nr:MULTISPECIES: PRD domain-containing protein [Clostridium]MBU5592601.1 PRD domain-containing protein [Clostridium simiarum]